MNDLSPRINHSRFLALGYCLVVFAAVNFASLFWLMAAARDAEMTALFVTPVVLFPLVVIAVWLVASAFAFRFEYSAFGRFRRAGLPSGPPVVTLRRSWGRVGRFQAIPPFFTWIVFTSGLGFRIFGMGAGFVPWASIHAMTREKSSGGYEISFDSREVRSPIVVPTEIAATIRTFMNEVADGAR